MGEAAIVISWVHAKSGCSGIEIVDGGILDRSDGRLMISFDLSNLMPAGLVAGTEPTVMSDAVPSDLDIALTKTGDADFVVKWQDSEATNFSARYDLEVNLASELISDQAGKARSSAGGATPGIDNAGFKATHVAAIDIENDQINFDLKSAANSSGEACVHPGAGGSWAAGNSLDSSDRDAVDPGIVDGIVFVSGYGNDVADYVDEEPPFGDQARTADPGATAEVFDALLFASVMSEESNMSVITFDTSNVAMIRDFEIL